MKPTPGTTRSAPGLGTHGASRVLMGVRASAEEELTGLEQTVHAESAYDHGVLGHAAS
ncbi:hypothetical protein [Streptomyces sp. NBC_01320]|uniref:hypothetical protein n=1 Tax=Streptomyces sp. NBC_01320 TaxID=2903824 RepID=UPI002E1647C5|nr:hypothetical protein OG395_28920 [Streptomyces sp. NBC_01320]